MATKTVNYSKANIDKLPNDKSVLYRILTKGGGTNYIGVASRGKVSETVAAHLGEVPGAKVRIEQFDKIGDARKKQANIVKRGAPKYNG